MINNDWIISGAWCLEAEVPHRCQTGFFFAPTFFAPLHKARYSPDGVKARLVSSVISAEFRCEALERWRVGRGGGGELEREGEREQTP